MEHKEQAINVNIMSYRDRSVPNIPGFSQYVEEISGGFCPYINPSMKKNGMSYTVIQSDTADITSIERVVFASGYILTELLRMQRFCEGGTRVPLLCENVIFSLSRFNAVDHGSFMAWPHWVLKSRYTEVGVLFGKFKKGDVESAKDGRTLPVSPCHILSIRESVPTKDPRFFEKADWLRPVLEKAQDIGQDVFVDITAGFSEIRKSIESHNAKPEAKRFKGLVQLIASSDFYDEAKKLAEESLRAQ